MAIDHEIRDEILKHDTNRVAAKLSALSSGKIDKYEYLTDEEILPSDQKRLIEKLNLLISLKALEKKRKQLNIKKKKTNRHYYKSKRKPGGFNQ